MKFAAAFMMAASVYADDMVSIQTHSNAIPKFAKTTPPLAEPSSSFAVATTAQLDNMHSTTPASLSTVLMAETTSVDSMQARSVPSAPVDSSSSSLQPGDVFGLVTISEDSRANGGTVVIYADGTLGIREPNAPGYLFEAILFPEYNLLIAPEPLASVKISDKGVFYLNTSLFNPSPIFAASNYDLKIAGGNPIVCPSWNSVLVLAKHNENIPCEDAISVGLGIVPITVD